MKKAETLTLDDLAGIVMCLERFGINIHPACVTTARRVRTVYEWACKREEIARNAAPDKRRLKALRYKVVADGTR